MASLEKRYRVLIIEHDQEMCNLLGVVLNNVAFTGGSKYEAEGCIIVGEERDVLAKVKRSHPDLLIVDVAEQGEADHFALLDDLRADPETGSIPIVALTPQERLSDLSTASYNVKATVTKPFDLSDLAQAIRKALGEPPLPSVLPPEAVQSEAANFREMAHRLLAERSRDAVFTWIQRLQHEKPPAPHRELDLRELIDHLPPIVETVAASVLSDDSDEFFRTHPDVIERTVKYAETRRRQGIAPADVIHEYAVLRNEILEVFHCCLPRQVAIDDILALNKAVNLTIDRIVEETVAAYSAGRVASNEAA